MSKKSFAFIVLIFFLTITINPRVLAHDSQSSASSLPVNSKGASENITSSPKPLPGTSQSPKTQPFEGVKILPETRVLDSKKGEIKDTVNQKAQEIKDLKASATAQLKSTIASKSAEIKEKVKADKEKFQATIKLKKEEVQEKIKGKKEEFQTKLKTIKDATKKEVVERVDKKFTELNQKIIAQQSERLDRLAELLEKINIRAAKAKEAGKDTTRLSSAITSAQDSLTKSRTAVATQAAQEYVISVTDEASLGSAVSKVKQQLMDDLNTSNNAVKNAKVAVEKALKALGTIKGEE